MAETVWMAILARTVCQVILVIPDQLVIKVHPAPPVQWDQLENQEKRDILVDLDHKVNLDSMVVTDVMVSMGKTDAMDGTAFLVISLNYVKPFMVKKLVLKI